MNTEAFIDYSKMVGDKATSATLKGLDLLGFKTGIIQGKIVSILLLAATLYLVVKVVSIGRKPLKYAIVLLLLVLLASLFLSF